jgi:DNA-binding MarR family transcriptional regulator
MSFPEIDYKMRILIALRKVIRAVNLYSYDLSRKQGLTTPQLVCLHAVAKMGNITLTELTQAVNLSASTVNGIVDRLEAKQYLIRQRSSRDQRRVHLILTEAGRGIVSSSPELLQDQLSKSLSGLPEPELLTITHSLERIVELMGSKNMDASPNLFPGIRVIEDDRP